MQFQNSTQFAPTPALGQPLKGPQPGTFPCRINPSSVATTIQVGSPMKLVAITDTEIVIDLCTSATADAIFGTIPLNTKKNTYKAGDVVDLFSDGNVLLLESAAAINAGAFLTISNTGGSGGGPSVATAAAVGAQIGGLALTTVGAIGALVAVKISGLKTFAQAPVVNTTGTFTVAAGAATVVQAAVTANSVIIITLKTIGGTFTVTPSVATITPGTGFTVAAGGGSDTSTYNYRVIG